MKGRLVWTREGKFVAEDEFGHSFVLQAIPQEGKLLGGVKPISLILFALAGCMGFDIVSILQKKRAKLKGFTVEIEGERSAEHPKRYTGITCVFKAVGEVNAAELQRSFELSRDKYCSVLATFSNPPQIDFKLEIAPEE